VRILILNWRCPQNPKAGGAEALTFEIARRLVAAGHNVEWFSGTYVGASEQEDLDGVHIVRAGHQWTVHWHAFRRYRNELQTKFDLVIDEVNTVPFFTPLWARKPNFMLAFQLARDVWWHEAFFPLSAIGYGLEPLYLRCYRRVPTLTISQSTAADLRGLGFTGPITIMPVGVESVTVASRAKAVRPTFIYVGRLTPSKRVSHILKAFAFFSRSAGPSDLWLVGDGPNRYRHALQSLAARLGITENVRFWGRLPTPEKHLRMAEAHALVMASVREGWGLVINEANACGTTAVVYDVPGLRDAVRHLETGIIVRPSPYALAQGMISLFQDKALLQRLSANAAEVSKDFSFDRTVDAFQKALGIPA
jgi:glycosyltransferase involved in cell wall biosynthesis